MFRVIPPITGGMPALIQIGAFLAFLGVLGSNGGKLFFRGDILSLSLRAVFNCFWTPIERAANPHLRTTIAPTINFFDIRLRNK